MSERQDIFSGAIGAVKSALSRVPGVGEAIGATDAYQSSVFRREVPEFIKYANAEFERRGHDIDLEWFETAEGELYARKVFDCGVDAQLSDKKELFAAALASGACRGRETSLSKLKFVDVLRALSRATLQILAEMHKKYGPTVHGPGRTPEPGEHYPHVDSVWLARELSKQFDPFLVESAVRELVGQGMLGNTAEWRKQSNGLAQPVGGFATGLTYSDFAYRFVEFVGLGARSVDESS